MKKISNPLTIIGMFSGTAQLAGTIVLPFVSPELQRIFIFYVMTFPLLLVFAFFYILIKHPDNLYSPSDFRDEDNYMKLRMTVKAISDRLTEVRDKNPESAKEIESLQQSLQSILNSDNKTQIKEYTLSFIQSKENGVTAFELADELCIAKPYAYRLLERMKGEGSLLCKNDTQSTPAGKRTFKRYYTSK